MLTSESFIAVDVFLLVVLVILFYSYCTCTLFGALASFALPTGSQKWFLFSFFLFDKQKGKESKKRRSAGLHDSLQLFFSLNLCMYISLLC